MNKLVAIVFALVVSSSAWADILLSPEEEATIKQHMEQGQKIVQRVVHCLMAKSAILVTSGVSFV